MAADAAAGGRPPLPDLAGFRSSLDAALPGWWNGRHDGLKIHCPSGRAGSNPAPGTASVLTVQPGLRQAGSGDCLPMARKPAVELAREWISHAEEGDSAAMADLLADDALFHADTIRGRRFQ